jgi:hypothetical protein
MWHLNYLDKQQEENYLQILVTQEKTLFDKVKERRDAIAINSIKRYLTDKKLKELIISKPKDLYSKINEYKRKFFLNEYDEWIMATKKKTQNRTPQEQSLVDKYQAVIAVFDYKSFIVDKPDVSYKIAKLIGVNTCVYCNRQYIFTIEDENNGHITRPEFDHYLPKSEYPFFALSLYNLIPSCHICNSNCKGTIKLDESLNPYLTKDKDYFKFTYNIGNNGLPSSVQIKDREKLSTEIEKFLDTFKIQEIYNYHTDLELKELYEFATKYSDTYLQEVLDDLKINLKVSQEEAYRILFGAELLEDKDNNRPLSKFKRDILKELRVIK